jgi:hypothetical protein
MARQVIANPGKAGGFLIVDDDGYTDGFPFTTRASANSVVRECELRREWEAAKRRRTGAG